MGTGGEGADIAEIWKQKAVGFFADKGISLAFDAASKLVGLDKILPASPQDKILAEVKRIEEQLAGIQQRLDTLTEKVDQAIQEQRTKNFNDILSALCDIYDRQQTFYTDYYQPLVTDTTRLGEIERKLGSADITPQERTQLEADLTTAKARVQKRQEEFRSNYNKAGLAQESDDKKIHQRLLPSGQSVLTAYGKMAMTKRFVTRRDSESIRALYEEFAQVEALASWMAAEDHATPEDECPPADTSPACVQNAILRRYLAQTEAEQKALPKMIPAAAVIDLEEKNATSTTDKPMWLVPTLQGQCWLPPGKFEFLHFRYPVCNEVDQTIADLNARKDVPGSNWAVPTRVQLTALMSKDCLADPNDPEKYVPGKAKCTSPLGGQQNARVGDYLANLDPRDPAWGLAFCVTTCTGFQPLRHVWTKETASARLNCGSFQSAVGPVPYYNSYLLYTGFDLYGSNLKKSWGYFPRLASQYENGGFAKRIFSDVLRVGAACDEFLYSYYNGGAGYSDWRIRTFGSAGPAPPRLGVVLATRYTDVVEDENDDGVDYMAQPSGG